MVIEKKTYQAGSSPRISAMDDIQGTYNGFRASSVNAAGATTTVTITNTVLTKDFGGIDAFNGEGLTMALTDLLVYAQAAGALVTVSSGADVIWQTLVGAGSVDVHLVTPIIINKGQDLVVAISAAGTSCSLAVSGHVLT